MAWKVPNETKVGAITAISITLLILGFNFLKGNNFTKKSRYLYAKFQKIDGLLPANPVQMNGLTVGSVYKTGPGDADLNWVLVTIRLDEPVNIPVNSLASVKTTLLGSSTLEIQKGNSTTHVKPGDTIQTVIVGGLVGALMDQLGPTQIKLDNALQSADDVMVKISQVLTDKAQEDLRQTLANLNATTANLTQATQSINILLNAQTGALTKAVNNLQQFTMALAGLKDKLPVIVGNLETTSQNLSQLDFKKTLASVDQTLASLNTLVSKANNSNSTIGALLNDKKLYDNLNSTVNSLNILMQDLRLNPKRYVNISVFGRKDKDGPLMKPLEQDSVTQEQKFPN